MLTEIKVIAWKCSHCGHVRRSENRPSRCGKCGKSAVDRGRGRPVNPK